MTNDSSAVADSNPLQINKAMKRNDRPWQGSKGYRWLG